MEAIPQVAVIAEVTARYAVRRGAGQIAGNGRRRADGRRVYAIVVRPELRRLKMGRYVIGAVGRHRRVRRDPYVDRLPRTDRQAQARIADDALVAAGRVVVGAAERDAALARA